MATRATTATVTVPVSLLRAGVKDEVDHQGKKKIPRQIACHFSHMIQLYKWPAGSEKRKVCLRDRFLMQLVSFCTIMENIKILTRIYVGLGLLK